MLGKLLRGAGWTAAILLILGGILHAVAFDVRVVPDDDKTSAAVAPSLAGGDTVLIMKRSKPHFGDLVFCTDPDDASKQVVGRVVGTAGDKVETEGHELTINNRRYGGEMACAEHTVTVRHPTSGSTVELHCDQGSIAGHPYMRGWSEKAGMFTPTQNTVGEGRLFLLSDDRSYHDDSRDFGAVPVESCSGRLFFRLWGKEGMKDEKRRMTFVQ